MVETAQAKRIQWLSEMAFDDCAQFGAKAIGLVHAAKNGALVPAGFGVSCDLVREIAEAESVGQYSDVLSEYVRVLLAGSPSRRLIVRSSSLYEDGSKMMFSGLFQSIPNVESLEEVLAATVTIAHESKSESLLPYFERAGVSIDEVHTAVIVQQYVEPEVGGIAQFSSERTLVEFTTDSVAKSLSGGALSEAFSLDTMQEITQTHFANEESKKVAVVIVSYFRKQTQFYTYAQAHTLSVEFACSDGELFVLQTKHAPLVVGVRAPQKSHALNAHMANKTFAMSFFIEHGLFTKKCEIVRAGWDTRAVTNALQAVLAGGGPVTIRYSEEASIGLPRAFVTTVDEGLSFIKTRGKESYDVIIHEYIGVTRSFEILLMEDKFILEHIPGMWESQNVLNPDVIIANNRSVTAYQFRRERQVVLDEKTQMRDELKAPLSRELVEKMFAFGQKIGAVARIEFPQSLPLNMHFVLDSASDEFQCLNIRPGFQAASSPVSVENLFVVSSRADLDAWDRERPVRLSLITDRGDENSLISAATILAKSKKPIVVDFGLLSHPAMVLREYGCELVPSYLVPQCFSQDEYEQLQLL